MSSAPDRPPHFSGETHDLGVCVLGPVAGDLETIAARLAGLEPWATMGRSAASFVAHMTRPMAATFRFAVRVDDRPVGFLSLRHPFMRGPYIETIALFEEAQRRGIGRAIVEWIAREAAGEATNVWLCVTEWNAPARAAYAAMGFVEIGPIPDVAMLGQTEIFLRRVLGPPAP
ncbi:MAG: GNAT family N-acetyltransferase [Siculibacillus sp.]|nr:GNAT family N-acetyltransferase [Siculibacillus sp.]